jgi:hypothetical protein
MKKKYYAMTVGLLTSSFLKNLFIKETKFILITFGLILPLILNAQAKISITSITCNGTSIPALYDGNINTYVQIAPNGTSQPLTIIIDLGGLYTISTTTNKSIIIYGVNSPVSSISASAYYAIDPAGTTYSSTPIGSCSTSTTNGFINATAAISTRYIKISATITMLGSYTPILMGEIEVYGQPAVSGIWYGSGSNIFYSTGNVLIGKSTQTNATYKLEVEGKIRATEIVVNSTGADFVFENNYKPRNLAELEQFVNTNKHLPDIPAASEMQTNGISISDMQTKLLQKVEELTLYMIELKKENDLLKAEIEKLKNK